ncbi:hypothetical protein J2X31_003303 [Flavobacterium arsenatis]|uniref:Methionyl-tRNA formyltransferase n=1 Tax=Flavobacterium arsenatis TaxID=1484332 RepID=A0ABU1TTS7_9FLAO|nr:hypothetical protein [Flavobacterium arsenatis]MDR6969273.1 hypothetical protein [Flavobacterium arsenatis]
MALRTVFNDENDNEMDCYLNDKGQVFIQVGEYGSDISEKNFITLDKNDANELIKMLNEIVKEME